MQSVSFPVADYRQSHVTPACVFMLAIEWWRISRPTATTNQCTVSRAKQPVCRSARLRLLIHQALVVVLGSGPGFSVCVCLFNLIYGAWASRQGSILLVSIANGHLNLIPRYLATWVLSSSDTDIAWSGVGVMPWNTAPMEMMHIVRQWFGT